MKKAYELPTHPLNATMVAFLERELDISMVDYPFTQTEQTGGWVMCDVYSHTSDGSIVVTGDDAVCWYPSMESFWEQTDEDLCRGVAWDTLVDEENAAHWDDDDYQFTFPKTNNAPMLVMMAQMWDAAKLEKVLASDIPAEDREAILHGLTLKKGATS